MSSSFHSRGHLNGGSTSFTPSGMPSQSSQYGSGSGSNSRSTLGNGGQRGFFPSPPPQAYSLPQPNDNPHMNQNIMNRRAGADSSLYQICLNLRKRLADVPGFEEHIAEMEEEEAEAQDATDPVTSMWNCLRRGYPLMTIFNAFRPPKPLEIDLSRTSEAKIGKAATYKFLAACQTNLKNEMAEGFLITDLYGEDTTGFVKVTKVVNRVLDLLEKRGLLLQRDPATADVAVDQPLILTLRQKIVDEIITTERDYVQHLENLQQFKNELEENGALAGDAVHDIFLNLNALLDFQRRFLIRVEQQNNLPESQQNWGKLLFHYKESFRVYEPFIANQERCHKTVAKEWDKLKKAAISPNLQGIVETQSVLLGFLSKPFQRLTKYPMLLQELHKKGGLDDERRQDLIDGSDAAKSILFRTNEAVAKEARIEAVAELQSRVEDWKGHKIEHFGELLLYGNFTVLKGEGAREVEREVSVIFDSLDPGSRALLLRMVRASQRLRPSYPKPSTPKHRSPPNPPRTRTPRRFTSALAGVPEEVAEVQHVPMLPDPPEKRQKYGFLGLKKTTTPPNAAASPHTPPSKTRMSTGSETPSEPTTPSRAPRLRSATSMSDLTASLALRFKSWSPKSKSPQQPLLFQSLHPGIPVDDLKFLLAATKYCSHLFRFNGTFTSSTAFLFTDPFSFSCVRPIFKTDTSPLASLLKKNKAKEIATTHVEKQLTDCLVLKRPMRVQYKIYLFERILLCCKEINPNKPKNKMLGNSKPLVDKKGKLKLQLKGRIFMQNVTDVLTLTRADKSSYTVQIFWKGDPGVENFVIRFADEITMIKWRDTVQMQKRVLTEMGRTSGQPGTSTTEFLSMKNLPRSENPYREEDDIEEDDTQGAQAPGMRKSDFPVSRNASNTSLRSISGQIAGPPPRMAPSRVPLPEHGNGSYAPPLTLNTNIPAGTNSPGEFPGNSYFSPSNESPVSTRSNSQVSMYPFPRQPAPGAGWSQENSKHRTAPAMGRAPSREGGPYTRPSLPAMAIATSQHPQHPPTIAQSRLRSASTPDIPNANVPGPIRQPNGQLLPSPENVPVPPIPHNMRMPINRSQTTSPVSNPLPIRKATQSPSVQQMSYDSQGQRLLHRNEDAPHRHTQGSYSSNVSHVQHAQSSSTPTSSASDDDIPYPQQLKVKIFFEPAPSHVTIVVALNIKLKSLIDRIDQKMVKISSASINKGTARLRYRDAEGDLLSIQTDDDVVEAIEEWGARHEQQLREGIVDDFELHWHERV